MINKGSPVQIQDTLPHALGAAQAAAASIGLECVLEKSELLLVHTTQWGPPPITLYNKAQYIPQRHTTTIRPVHVARWGGAVTAALAKAD